MASSNEDMIRVWESLNIRMAQIQQAELRDSYYSWDPKPMELLDRIKMLREQLRREVIDMDRGIVNSESISSLAADLASVSSKLHQLYGEFYLQQRCSQSNYSIGDDL